jgi:hypothetical protein
MCNLREKEMIGYKLFRKRKDGTYGPLFIDRRLKMVTDMWYKSNAIPTKGYAYRPGWHICASMDHAPHLKLKEDRVWCRVQFFDAQRIQRPASQGGFWWLADRMRILYEV